MAASLRVAVVLLLACCALVHQASAVDVDRSRSKARAEVNAEAFAALQREQAEFRALLEDAQPAPAATQPAQNQVPANATVVPVSATGKPPAVPVAAQPAKNNSRRPDLTTGYGLYTGLLMRVKNNANAEKRAVFLSNTTEQTECNTTLTRVNTSLATRRNQVEAARNTIIVEERKIFTAEWELNTTILPLLNFKRRQQYSVNSTVADGDVRRNLEARIFANKTADAQTVLNAVRAVSMLLHSIRNGGATPQNGTGNATVAAAQARFREKMEEASSQIHDPELMRFVEATMQTFQAVANSSNASAPSNATSNSTLPSKETDGMRLLIHLLRSQIQQYMAQLSRADAANNETWAQTRLQLTAQLAILTEEVSKLDADRLAEERKIATATEIRNNQVTLINSNLLNEIAILEKEQATIMADCDFKLTAMNNQTQSLNDLLGTVAALEKLDFTRQDESVLKRIMENIKLPPADRVDNTGKRCCMVCRRGRKACGNRCVLAEETCSAAPGCACDLSGFRRS